MTDSSPLFQRRIYGRRLARPLNVNRRQALENTLPSIEIKVPVSGDIDLSPIQNKFNKLYLEVGFGVGDHLIAKAQENPDCAYIGCEPFVSGVASLLVKIEKLNLKNIWIVVDDARLLIKALPESCLDGVYILFPDPWPKKRHQKRRIIQTDFVDDIVKSLKPYSHITTATDDEEYQNHILQVFQNHPEFALDLKNQKDIFDRPEGWPETRYENKGILKNNTPAYMIWKRKN